jgi:hypothetical protein
MPVKRRISKMKSLQLTPEVFAAFDAGDKNALRRALSCRIGTPRRWTRTAPDRRSTGTKPCRAISRPDALEIRREILAAMGRARRRQKHAS